MARKKGKKKSVSIARLPSGNFRKEIQIGVNSSGKPIRKSFSGKTELEVLQKIEDFKNGRAVDDKITVSKAICNYIEAKRGTLQESTLHGYECIYRSCLQSLMNKDVHQLLPVDVQKAISEDAQQGKSYKTIKNAFGLLKAALSYHNAPLASHNYSFPEKKKRKDDLPELAVVLKIINGSSVELPALLSLWCGGMRISEVRGLQYRDIIDKDGKKYICIERSNVNIGNSYDCLKCTKTEASTRLVPLPNFLYDKIMAKPHNNDSDFIIDGSYRAVSGRFKRLMKANGINGFTFHGLRKLFATSMNALGVPKETLQLLGGWSNSIVLDSIYICPRQSELENSIDKLSGLILPVVDEKH